jgi:spore germination protein GerM
MLDNFSCEEFIKWNKMEARRSAMNIPKIIIIILILLLFIFPQRVYAKELNAFYIAYDEENEAYFYKESLELKDEITEKSICLIFNMLFKGTENANLYKFPEGTRALSADIKDDLLTLTVSSEILNYGGGSFYETILRDQIVKTALDIEGVGKVTLLIDNQTNALVEGLIIKEADQCVLTTEETTNLEK